MHLGIQTPSWYQCKSRSITEGEEKRKFCKLLSSHYFSTISERERERETERLRDWETEWEKEKRMERRLAKVRTKGWNFVVAEHRPVSTDRYTPYLELHTSSFEGEHWKNGRQLFYIAVVLQHRMQDIAKSYLRWKIAHIMLGMAAKCSKYATNWGFCLSFWIMRFDAD